MAKRLSPKVKVEEVVNEPEPDKEQAEMEVSQEDNELISVLQTTPYDEEPPLTREELIELRWNMFGKCPHCGFYVKGWTPGAFDPNKYKGWEKEGRDGLTGHRVTCDHKYLRMP